MNKLILNPGQTHRKHKTYKPPKQQDGKPEPQAKPQSATKVPARFMQEKLNREDLRQKPPNEEGGSRNLPPAGLNLMSLIFI
ncbi:hypothetical protein [Methylomonas koyamae]|uniref:hypothetical protein n=1 Tax=Methylomonas koyamae TaxID=702114 RepID=UPI0028730B8B|nr:hypothetical protein [Methylomonas koyamae]WNB75573.1 hypothetical protein RI210_20190 [Methylomonas koyamae]